MRLPQERGESEPNQENYVGDMESLFSCKFAFKMQNCKKNLNRAARLQRSERELTIQLLQFIIS